MSNILDGFKRESPKKKRERRAKDVEAAGEKQDRARKQKLAHGSLLNMTTFTVAVKGFAFLLVLALLACIAYAIYLGIDIFIS